MSKKTAEQTPAQKGATPMIQQYWSVKDRYPECMLFYRMGDFYELFFDDAIQASKVLDITLTKRGTYDGKDIPMCGVPVHSHETYLSRLIKYGFKVAICEQTESPEEAKKRDGYKALVNRDVVRVITPGTITEDNLLDKSSNNYLASLVEIGKNIGLSWLDLSTGEFILQPASFEMLSAALVRINPGELLISDKLSQKPEYLDICAEHKKVLTIQANSRFDSENARKRLEKMFGVGTLDSYGGFSRAEIAAAGSLIDYVELTQKGAFPHLSAPKQLPVGSVMEIDAATRRNLELTETLNGQKKGSLLSTINQTVTGAGSRMLAAQLAMPLTDISQINERLDSIEYFVNNPFLRHDIIGFLRSCPDIERAFARLSVGRGGPRDLAVIRDTLSQSINLMTRLSQTDQNDQNTIDQVIPSGIKKTLKQLKSWGRHHVLIDQLEHALMQDLPNLARDGGFIKKGYSQHLDELKTLRDESRQLIADLQKNYIKISGVDTIKIKYNNVLGYFIDVTSRHADKLMSQKDDEDNIFIHRQTLANNVRFSTVELSELERKISEASSKALTLELELFQDLVSNTLNYGDGISETAQSIACLDVASSLAQFSIDEHYTRPHLSNDLIFDIKFGRHPVVEKSLKNCADAEFIANNCNLGSASKLWLLTGPNMAGKSTFLRQNALIALLAQMGCYVPAEQANIGIIDRLFSRVGAADDLARGRSTFMVEMVETATILNLATERSLVILDEIGRGTATFDGLSIAWACVENLHEVNQCRTIFATHYHELTSLTEKLSNLTCYTMKVKEWKDEIIFLHEVTQGAADRSYGIHVAKLAGLPKAVIKRSEQILKQLEKNKQSGTLSSLANDLPLFNQVELEQNDNGSIKQSATLEQLMSLNADDLTPRVALETLYALISSAKKENEG